MTGWEKGKILSGKMSIFKYFRNPSMVTKNPLNSVFYNDEEKMAT